MFAKLAYLFICITNDFKHIHIHASGSKFFEVHELFNEYYEKASEQSDVIQELAIEYNELLQNLSYAADLIKYKPANIESYDWKTAAKKAKELMGIIYKSLLEVSKACEDKPDVKNQLEEFMRYWHKEAYYKIERWLNGID